MSDVFAAPKPGPKPKKAPRDLVRRTPMKKRNEARAIVSYARNFGEWSDEIRRMNCWACGRRPTPEHPSDPAHTVGRGMGGRGGDKRTLLPLCRSCHTRFDEYKLDLPSGIHVSREMARGAAERLWAERGPREDAA